MQGVVVKQHGSLRSSRGGVSLILVLGNISSLWGRKWIHVATSYVEVHIPTLVWAPLGGDRTD